MPNVLITPHTGGETHKYEDNVLDLMVENIARLQRGEATPGEPDRLRGNDPCPAAKAPCRAPPSFFDDGGFKALLTDLVAIPSTAQEEGREADLHDYLHGAIRPWLERLGFAVRDPPEPARGLRPDPDRHPHRGSRRARPCCSMAMATRCAGSTTSGAPA